MSDSNEIIIPKGACELLPDCAKETIWGFPKGSRKQYRCGRLHIREYDNEYRIHTDAVDPMTHPIGHLIHDAPEVLGGLAGIIIGTRLAKKLKKEPSVTSVIVAATISGYLGFVATKKIKQLLSSN